MPKFNPVYWSGSLCKTDSRNAYFAKSAGTVLKFPFFNPVFKNTKIKQVFLAIKNNAPGNWTKIGYTFFPVKYRLRKRSGKLRIQSQVVRVTLSCIKILLTKGGDSPLLTLYIYLARY